jgi:hypothetical protein
VLPEKMPAKYKLEIIDAANIVGRQYIGAAQVYISLMIQQISFTLYGANNSPRFAYSSGHYLLVLLYWGGNENK